MKVKELIEKLKEFDGELEVFYSDWEYGDCAVTELEIIPKEHSIVDCLNEDYLVIR